MSADPTAALALLGYGGFLALSFGWSTVRSTRATGESAWRRPISTADLVGESLCALGCLLSLAAPALHLAGMIIATDTSGSAARFAAGVASLAAGTGLAFWAQHHLGGEWRAGIEASRRLVTSGPFARSRNPFYVACLAASAGVLLLVPSAVAALGFALHVVATQVIVRVVEEPLLARTHGQAYADYRLRTGRFLPSLRSLRKRSSGPCR